MPYDLIIVGGGPGGAIAAAAAAGLGLRTAIIDKSKFPRDKVCGDAVSGKCLTVMRRLRVPHDLTAVGGNGIAGITFGVPSGESISIPFAAETEGPAAFACRRIDFDNLLFRHAASTGVEVIEGREVGSLLQDDDKVIGVVLTGSSKTEAGSCVHAPVVVGADGANSVVARSVGAVASSKNHLAAGIRAYYEGIQDDPACPNHFEIHYLSGIAPGYFWIFPLGNGVANLGVGMLSSDLRRKSRNLNDLLETCFEHPRFRHRFATVRRTSSIKGWRLPLGSKPRPMAGPGWLLVGDAASLIDPFTGEGIANAMFGGQLAAETALHAHEAGDFSADTLSYFETNLLARIQPELRLSRALQKLTRFPSVLSLMVSRARRSHGFTQLLSGMFDDVDLRRQLVSPVFYLRLLMDGQVSR